MNSERGAAALLLAMLLVGAAAWWVQLRPELEIDDARLAALPRTLGEWRGQDVPLESGVERILRADLNLQRAYRRASDEGVVWLYVGYYGTARGGRPEHTPDVCYPSAGWQIDEERRWQGEGADARANEYVVSRGDARRLVHFWYRSARSPVLLGALEQSLDQVAARWSDGRADGALVRLSTVLGADGLEAARARLRAFRARLEPELASRWPDERPPS